MGAWAAFAGRRGGAPPPAETAAPAAVSAPAEAAPVRRRTRPAEPAVTEEEASVAVAARAAPAAPAAVTSGIRRRPAELRDATVAGAAVDGVQDAQTSGEPVTATTA